MIVKKNQQTRLLNNACDAYSRAQSKWAKKYWLGVYVTLLKRFKKLN